MTTVVFVGPTLPLDVCRRELDAVYLPPVAQGDVYRAALDGPDAIGIIDGYFERVPAVWHKEILWAMARGIHVFGAASMGALRAAELAPFGMVGVGAIFEAFRDGRLEDDDEVTVVHGDVATGYRMASVAMVDIRATLAAAVAAGVITDATHDDLIRLAKAQFYPQREYPSLLAAARATRVGLDQVAALEAWLPSGQVSQKRADALAMLHALRDWRASSPTRLSVDYHFEHTDVWEQVVQRSERTGSVTETDTTAVNDRTMIEELQLDRGLYERAMAGALVRALGLAEAERRGVEVGTTLVREAVTALRRAHALVEEDALPRWLAEQELDIEAFGALMVREGQIGWVRAMYAPDIARHLMDWLRVSGIYRDVIERARAKQAVLRAHGLEHPALADTPLDESQLLRWFFEEQRGEPVPARLDLHAYVTGYANRTAFIQAVLRDYLSVTLRAGPPQAEADPA